MIADPNEEMKVHIPLLMRLLITLIVSVLTPMLLTGAILEGVIRGVWEGLKAFAETIGAIFDLLWN